MKLDMTILYVSDVATSVTFFATALDTPPLEQSPGFALFRMGDHMLGLWKRNAVQPETRFDGASSELVLHVESDEEVEALHRRWSRDGLSVIDPPVRREFGYSFVAEGPDAQRLRVLKAGD